MAASTRRKADNDITRARTNALTYLRRQANTYRQRELTEAAEALKRAQIPDNPPDPNATMAHVVIEHARDVAVSTLAGLGLTPPLTINTSTDKGTASAWTDYTRINVTMSISAFPGNKPTPENFARLVTVTKGLVYHEAGHLLFSVPFAHLAHAAQQQGCELPRAFTNTKFHDELHSYAWVANVLEDQRMECALVRLSPVFENYLRVTAAYMIIEPALVRGRLAMMWPYICGRTFLPKDLLSAIRADAVKEATGLGLLPALHKIEAGVRAYKRATTERELFEAVLESIDAFREWFGSGQRLIVPVLDHHEDPGNDANQQLRLSLVESATGESTSAEYSAEESDTTDDGSANDDGASPSAFNTASIRELAASSIRESVQGLVPRHHINEMLAGFHVQMGWSLPRDPTATPMTPDQSIAAHRVKAGMLDVLEPLLTQADPGWMSHREEGVLDPVAYQLRSPGDTDYWNNREEHYQPGRDITLSLVLDVSYSMSSQIGELSIAAIGVRLACEQLGIPCTVTTFANEASVLFEAHEPTEEVTVYCQGGTYPLKALEELRNQRCGKSTHLVVVFTDGHWAGVPSMGPFRQPGMLCIGVAMGEDAKQALSDRHFDEVIPICDACALVRPIQRLLIERTSW